MKYGRLLYSHIIKHPFLMLLCLFIAVTGITAGLSSSKYIPHSKDYLSVILNYGFNDGIEIFPALLRAAALNLLLFAAASLALSGIAFAPLPLIALSLKSFVLGFTFAGVAASTAGTTFKVCLLILVAVSGISACFSVLLRSLYCLMVRTPNTDLAPCRVVNRYGILAITLSILLDGILIPLFFSI